MQNSQGIWDRITTLGNTSENSESSSFSIFRSNQLAIILFAFSVIFFALNFYNKEFTIAVSFLLTSFLCISVLVFNALELSKFSRPFLSFLILPILLVPVFTFGQIETNNFQVWLYSSIAAGFLPFFVLDRRKERGLLVSNLMFNAIVLLSLQNSLRVADITVFDSLSKASSNFYSLPQFNFFSITLILYALFGDRLLPEQVQKPEKPVGINVSESVVVPILTNDPSVPKSNQLERILKLLNAKRVTAFIEDEQGYLKIAESQSTSAGLPQLMERFNFKTSTEYQEVLSNQRLIIFNCLNDSRTQEFYHSKKFNRVLASLEVPFYNGISTAGVVRCESIAGDANWTESTLNEVEELVRSYAFNQEINPKKELQAKEQFDEQQKLILSQNKELTEQRLVLEDALQQQKSTQNKLAKKEAEARSLLKSISDHNYVFEYNRRGDIIWLNEKSLDLFGMSLEEVRGKNWSEFDLSFVKNDEADNGLGRSIWRDLLNGKSIKRETRIDINEKETWVAATFLPILDEKGKPVRILGIAQDITDIHAQQEKIKEQNQLLVDTQDEIIRINNDLEVRVKERTSELKEKNEQLVEYTYINAHMLRAPVCNILGLVELLENGSIKEENRDIINYLHKAAFELDDIVSKINETLRAGYKLDRKEWKSKANKAILDKEVEVQ